MTESRYGLGLPIALRPKENLIPYTRVNFAYVITENPPYSVVLLTTFHIRGRPIYQIGISFFKIALLISYLRLFKGTNQSTYVRTVWATIILVFLGHLACTLCLVFACDPVDKSWNPLKDGTCLPPGPSFTGYASVTIASDIIVALLPLPVLWTLNISLKKKIGLAVVFILGLFTTLCSIFRYLQINRIQFGDGNSTMLIVWGVIEFNVGVSSTSKLFLNDLSCFLLSLFFFYCASLLVDCKSSILTKISRIWSQASLFWPRFLSGKPRNTAARRLTGMIQAAHEEGTRSAPSTERSISLTACRETTSFHTATVLATAKKIFLRIPMIRAS